MAYFGKLLFLTGKPYICPENHHFSSFLVYFWSIFRMALFQLCYFWDITVYAYILAVFEIPIDIFWSNSTLEIMVLGSFHRFSIDFESILVILVGHTPWILAYFDIILDPNFLSGLSWYFSSFLVIFHLFWIFSHFLIF